MRIPHIKLSFDRFVCETEKAYCVSIKRKETWLPKSICSNFMITGKKPNGYGSVNIAPFKFTELTGVVPQSLDSFLIQEIDTTLRTNEIPDYDIVEPKGIFLKKKQIEKIITVKRLSKFFVYGQMRTGKTVISIAIAESRLNAGLIDNLIVIAPLRTKAVWDLHINFSYFFIPVEHFSNIHTRKNIQLKCNAKTMVILDESHQIKNKSAYRTEVIISMTKYAGHKCILTGTPIGKHAGDLFFQFQFLDPCILNYSTYESFSAAHLLYGGRQGKTVVAYTNIEEIAKRISPYTITMSRNEMDIDRKKEYSVVTYDISNKEKYNLLKAKYQKCYEQNFNNQILGYMVKLQQCANGYEIDDNDKCIGYKDNGRIECLKQILNKYKGMQIVIYFKYNEDLLDLKKTLSVPILSGKTNIKLFNDTIFNFNLGTHKVIALQQQLSIGFSLKACDVMIYYSRKFGSISSAQSEDRACETTDKVLYVIDIAAKDTIDEMIKTTITKQFQIINIFKNDLHESK